MQENQENTKKDLELLGEGSEVEQVAIKRVKSTEEAEEKVKFLTLDESTQVDTSEDFMLPALANPMLQKFIVTAVEVTPSISAKTFAGNFLSSSSLRKASEKVNASAYISSLERLCETEGNNLAITSAEYVFANQTKIKLFDLRCKARFEDDLVDRICRTWITKSGDTYGKVCPLRRGICVGLINNEHLILAVGNCKFFYGEESEILSTAGEGPAAVLLSEKANGEYTVLSSTKVNPTPGVQSDDQPTRWITVGSKNVRLCLPYFENSPDITKGVLESLVYKFNKQNTTSEADHRYAYLQEMLDLWLQALASPDSKQHMLEELDRGTTLVGEQVGVHAHIFTGYEHPHIRLFGSLPFSTLTTEVACSLRDLKNRMFQGGNGWHNLQLVNFETYLIPARREELKEGLERVASGSMEVYGEGTVVYVYDGSDNGINLYKFKCQEYALDRRLRTVLSRTAGELAKSGMTRLRLKDETKRVSTEIRKAFDSQFTKVNSQRAEERIHNVPAMIAFLDRHQATAYCSDFSDNFVSFVNATMRKAKEYGHLADQMFLGVEDVLQEAFSAFLEKYQRVQVPVRSVGDLARDIVSNFKELGGREKFDCIGIASGPGGGKTAILHEVFHILEEEKPGSSKICDRDAYVIADPGAKGDVIHRQWISDINQSALKDGKLCLVGNTFTGGFADRLEKETKTRILLFALKEHTIPVTQKRLVPEPSVKRGVLRWTEEQQDKARAALFDLECLRRLSQRLDVHADGSTLSMGLGCKVVLEKFFASQPEEQMMKRRLKEKTAAVLRVTEEEFDLTNLQQLVDVAKSICVLRQTVANPPLPSSKGGGQDPSYVPRITRGHFPKVSFPYYMKSSPKPKVRYAALIPEASIAKSLYEIADIEVIRTDCHITLAYHPEEAEITRLLKLFEGRHEVTLKLPTRVTVTTGGKHKLQFLTVAVAEESDQALMTSSAHVTLGSTNADVLPHVTSGDILEHLIKTGISLSEPQGPIDVQLDKAKYQVIIEPFGEPLRFIGTPQFVCSSK